jgi:uncharacterized protein YggE
MWKSCLSTLFLLAAPVFAQLESHTLTISAARRISVQPDEVVFGLSVSSAPTVTLDQIVASLASLNVTSANLTGIGFSNPATLQWNFTLAVPLSALTEMIGSLTKLQQSGLAITFDINGTQVSPQLQKSQACSTADLVMDATAQAQKLAAAAGLALGPILKLSNEPLTPPLGAVPTNVAVAARITSFVVAAAAPVTCSLAVEFQLHP